VKILFLSSEVAPFAKAGASEMSRRRWPGILHANAITTVSPTYAREIQTPEHPRRAGEGEHRYQRFFAELARAFPRQVAYDAAFSEHRARLIEAGSDLFLMPSRYEPCGLNQMYSLRYGTVPVVHRTGGLADTVSPWDPRSGRGTGFAFERFDERGLAWALSRALDSWGSGAGADRERWTRLQRNGMGLPLGWSHRVGEYVEVYRQLAPEAPVNRRSGPSRSRR
jgi:glycogen synthase